MRIKTIEGKLNGEGRKIAITLSRFNSFITERLLEGALDCLLRHNVKEEEIAVVRVPGAWEIPLVAQKLAESEKYDAVICLGAVIRGETPHFDYVAAEVSKGIANISLKTGTPISFGVLTTDTVDQAVDRAGSKAGNKGWESALGALEMSAALEDISSLT